MKKLTILLFILLSFGFIKNVEAGTLSWKNSTRLSENTFEFYLEAKDLNLNYISGTWEIENGKIIDIKMNDGWINNKGNAEKFYYFHNGIKKGDYLIATIKIELTSDSMTKINNLDMGINSCTKDFETNYFDINGNITNEQNYRKTCLNNDASLKDLKINKGILSPTFESNIDNYETSVENDVKEIIFTPTLSNPNAKILSNTTCSLNIGKNICEILVEAENGEQKVYRINVTRKSQTSSTLSDDATLKELTINHGTLFPDFNPQTKNYSIKVGFDITEITWQASVNDPKAHILSNSSCQLNVGENICEILVEAENKNQTTYKLHITREQQQTEENLKKDTSIKDLFIENAILTEEFNKDKTTYTLKVNENITTIILHYTMVSNNLNYTIPFKIDTSTKFIDLEIKSLDEENKITYRFNLMRTQEDQKDPEDETNLPNSSTSNDEIENPQTGIFFSFKNLIILLGLFATGIICFKKKNIIPKL